MKKLISLIVFTLLIMMVSFGCKKKDNVPNTANNNPAAIPYSFNGNGSMYVNDPIQFVSNAPSYCTFLWNFGDGSTSTERFPYHTYSIVDSFIVTLVIKDSMVNIEYTISKIIHINPYLGSHITSLIGGPRIWNGSDSKSWVSSNYVIVDTLLAIEIVDPGTIVFMST